MSVEYFNWDNSNFIWNDNVYTWDEVCTTIELLDVVVDTYYARGGLPLHIGKKDKLPKKLEDRVITLICKVKNQITKTYNDPILIKNEINKNGIEISDVNMLIKEILSIDITVMEKEVEL